MVHRDVKPSNIVLVQAENDEGRIVEVAKVCDFGIAAQAGARDLVGTPQYMSPEQCEGGEVDARSDVYALGVILFELATGRLPFSHDDPVKLINMQLNDPPPRPSSFAQMDRRLEALILKTLEKEPSQRPQSMRDLRSALRDLTRPSLELHAVGVGRTGRTGESPVPPAPAFKQTAESFTNPHQLAMQLKREPVSALREKIANPDIFAREARLLAGAMRVMLQMEELAALGQVIAIFRQVATDPNAGQSAEIAASLVRAMQDPQGLAPVAEKALADHDEAAPKLLSGLGLGAAHALYNARIRLQPTPPVRGRFVSAMRGIGAAGWPLVWAALQRNAPGDMRPHEPRLAEDLLRAAIPPTDDAAGSVIANYLRWGEPPVRRAAITPLVAVWGERSRPLLLAVLSKDPDDGVRVAAVKGLRELRAIDEHVVRKLDEVLAPSVTQDTAVSDALKTAVAEALAEASPDARPIAAAVLKRALSPKGGVFMKRMPAMPSAVLIPMARAYVAIGGDEAKKLVEELARAAEEPLRTQLVGLVGTRR
jgi:serine/threonine-protein kinase